VGTLAGPALGGALKSFASKHKAVDIRLGTARSTEVSHLVRCGEATIGLRYETDRARDLDSVALDSEPLVVACAPSHRFAGRTIASLAALRTERWLAFPEIAGQRESGAAHIAGIFRAHGLGEIDWTAVDSLTAQKRLVEADFGLALVPSNSVAEEIVARSIALIRARDLKARNPITLVTRKNGFLSAAAKALRAHLVNAFRERKRYTTIRSRRLR
jgi:DNA-binding transcriptional LysR family regulator